jgi:hypothetical protein
MFCDLGGRTTGVNGNEFFFHFGSSFEMITFSPVNSLSGAGFNPLQS